MLRLTIMGLGVAAMLTTHTSVLPIPALPMLVQLTWASQGTTIMTTPMPILRTVFDPVVDNKAEQIYRVPTVQQPNSCLHSVFLN